MGLEADTVSEQVESEPVVHLMVAVLAVGGYSLQRAWNLLPSLQKEGLTDSKAVEDYDEAEIVRRLSRSGYDRGPIVTASMAKRLMALHTAVRNGVLAQTVRLLREDRVKDAEKVLRTVKGVGPVVFNQFAVLEGAMK
jgi:hypothetical protein